MLDHHGDGTGDKLGLFLAGFLGSLLTFSETSFLGHKKSGELESGLVAMLVVG